MVLKTIAVRRHVTWKRTSCGIPACTPEPPRAQLGEERAAETQARIASLNDTVIKLRTPKFKPPSRHLRVMFPRELCAAQHPLKYDGLPRDSSAWRWQDHQAQRPCRLLCAVRILGENLFLGKGLLLLAAKTKEYNNPSLDRTGQSACSFIYPDSPGDGMTLWP
jgi:hypothetical protein